MQCLHVRTLGVWKCYFPAFPMISVKSNKRVHYWFAGVHIELFDYFWFILKHVEHQINSCGSLWKHSSPSYFRGLIWHEAQDMTDSFFTPDVMTIMTFCFLNMLISFEAISLCCSPWKAHGNVECSVLSESGSRCGATLGQKLTGDRQDQTRFRIRTYPFQLSWMLFD